MPSKDVNALRAAIHAARSVVVLAGAGLSVASGLPTFRGPGGLWRTFDAMSLATMDAFKANPSRSWEFYEYRRQKALSTTPNAAHDLLALLSLPSTRSKLLPSSPTFHLITQNVDDLSRRALAALVSTLPSADPEHEPDSEILEMHGSIVDVRCSKCGKVYGERGRDPTPLTDALAGIVERVEGGEEEKTLEERDLPACEDGHDRALLRPGVVWFGEVPHHLEEIEEILSAKGVVLLVVGTSGSVYPAAGFAHTVKRHGGQVAIFNVDKSEGDDDADFLILGRCEETLAQVLQG
ncbi:DHS-like NAD/FAD-binding domain-containing protein [Pseudohyphozyma bogoriensis]|nr:DHS-like NAD/FAD-binding domain-containing protein [Pseudohyphozyma bogoriensis]